MAFSNQIRPPPSTHGKLASCYWTTASLDLAELEASRRELIKPELDTAFRSLCTHKAGSSTSSLLFGDNFPQRCKELKETHRLGIGVQAPPSKPLEVCTPHSTGYQTLSCRGVLTPPFVDGQLFKASPKLPTEETPGSAFPPGPAWPSNQETNRLDHSASIDPTPSSGTAPHCLSVIGGQLQAQGISPQAANVILHSWRSPLVKVMTQSLENGFSVYSRL
ncbi:uncharacterized protein LOC135153287 [Lytechinus pictus]|uniref:uncharacterized protein LOC135153287 n=1 Tax=Lytechinus pictus TaxID=7653 RepID=UPI0030BA1EF0